jgi:L-cysteine desulfidase
MQIPQSAHTFQQILREELVSATGCTEPVSIALAAAKARQVLGDFPNYLQVECSRNVYKNARCVTVPNSGGLRGIEASAILGLMAGKADLGLEVLSDVSTVHLAQARKLLAANFCTVSLLDSEINLHIMVNAGNGDQQVTVEIKHAHDHISRIIQNGQTVFERAEDASGYNAVLTDRSVLSVDGILEYIQTCDLAAVQDLLERQVVDNLAIAVEGLENPYGVEIGKTLLRHAEPGIWSKVKAYSAAASEARMSGCALPVITNSGSGNQGITASVPVIVYAQERGFPKEMLLRALLLSNLLTIHQKTGIGRLSAFCGAVSAACAVAAAFAYLEAGSPQKIKNAMTNNFATIVGMVCDGAKPSCAAKIVVALEAAILGFSLAMEDRVYEAHTGILKDEIEANIRSVSRLASQGMKETDAEILKIMTED